LYDKQKKSPASVGEPAVAYRSSSVENLPLDNWNPNIPFHGTQEEWWDHFHRIEEGEFMTLEEFDSKFAIWKREYLANKLK